MRKKDKNSKDCPSDTSRRTTLENAGKTRLQYPNYAELRGGQRLKLHHDLDGRPLQWPSEWRDG